MVKTCSKCGIEKDIELFNKAKNNKDGYNNICKECVKKYTAKYYITNKNKLLYYKKIYSNNNKENIKEYFKEYYENNKEKSKEYYEKNKENLKKKRKENNEKNKENRNNNHNKRIKNDTLYKLSCNIRTNINQSFKNKKHHKKSKTQDILGCTFKEFKEYIENQFQQWMNWNNYGNWDGITTEFNTSWDLDHIIPISSAKTEEDIYRLNHYTNFQPLCSYTNRYIKKDKLE